MTAASSIVQRVWNYCTVLHDDGVSYGDYREQLTYLLFLMMDAENREKGEKSTARDKVNLDIFWLRDESLEDSANLPDPDVLAAEIMEDLQAGLVQFGEIVEDLGVMTVSL